MGAAAILSERLGDWAGYRQFCRRQQAQSRGTELTIDARVIQLHGRKIKRIWTPRPGPTAGELVFGRACVCVYALQGSVGFTSVGGRDIKAEGYSGYKYISSNYAGCKHAGEVLFFFSVCIGEDRAVMGHLVLVIQSLVRRGSGHYAWFSYCRGLVFRGWFF